MKASGFENLIPFGYHDRFKGSAQGSIGSMMLESVRYICGSPRLRTLFPTLFMLFAGWILAQTYVPIVITSLYDGPDPPE